MRSEMVFTHLTCNQNCRYCSVRRAEDERAFIAGPAVRERIAAAISSGARELVLTGGEPTMRRDLPGLVRFARERGAEAVILETNGTLLDGRRAAELGDAGLVRVRLNLSAWGSVSDEVTRDPGGFERTLRGLAGLMEAELPVELSVALVRSTIEGAGRLPERVVEHLGSARGLWGMVVRVPTSSPDPSELVSYEEAARALERLDAGARRVGLRVKLAADSGPPPCVFGGSGRVAHLFSLTPGARRRSDHEQLPACAGCRVNDRCSGIPRAYLQRFPPPEMRPITEDRVRRRLSLISTVEEQIQREFVQPSRDTDPRTGEPVEGSLIRVVFHCNQACRFCFVSTHLPPPEEDAVERAILEAGRAGKQVTLTGGEPTLHPRLAHYVRMVRENSRYPVSLQTNAIRLADAALTDALADAGLGWVQVSLHGSTAELSDAMTEAPGTFDKQVLGIDNLHRHADIGLTINFVITRRNHADLVPFVRMCAARWPRAFVNISFVGASSDVVPRDTEMVPRYTEVLPHLSAALAEGTRLGIRMGGFESMCGIPLCLVPDDARPTLLAEIPEGYDQGEFLHPSACEGCSLRRKCWGVRRGYFELYGAGELAPLRS